MLLRINKLFRIKKIKCKKTIEEKIQESVMRFNVLFLPAAAICMSTALFSSENKEEMVSFAMPEKTGAIELPKSNKVERSESQMMNIDVEKLVVSKNSINGFVNLELLYWRAEGDRWIYGYALDSRQQLIAPGSLGGQTSGIKTIRGKAKWKPGARLELGYATAYNWNISGIWTYYHNRSVSNHRADNGLAGNIFLGGTGAKSVSKINYNVGDLQFSSSFQLLQNLCLKPYFSARAAWIEQNQRNTYTGDSILPAGVFNGTYRQATDWSGFGPRLGLDIACHFGKTGLRFFGGFSASLLYGSIHMKTNLDYLGTLGSVFVETRDRSHALKTNVQALIGADMKWWFDHCKKAISLYAVWETNYWWHMEALTPLRANLTNELATQDLTLSGVSGGLTFEF